MVKKKDDSSGPDAADKLQKALQDAAARAAELSKSPVARSMLAAGLVTAAAALTANKKLRDNARKAGRDAADGVEAAADNASRIGAAIVTAATDAVRKIMASFGEEEATPAARKPAARKPAAKKPAAKKPATRTAKPRAAAAKTSAATKAPAKTTRAKPAAKRAGAKSGARGGAAKPRGKGKPAA